MHYFMQYIKAIKNLNKKLYLTPFLIFIYLGSILQGWDPWSRFINHDGKELSDIVLFIVSSFQVYILIFIRIIFYPHASFFVQTTWLYRKVFGNTLGVVSSGLSRFANIGKNIPDDVHIRGSHGTSYTIRSGHKSKRDRVSDMRASYGYYLIMKFFLKDVALRLFTHLGILAISPILFLIAVPMLKKRGQLVGIEK